MSEQPECSKYKRPFLEKYEELVRSISAEHFREYDKITPNERTMEIFQSALLNNILSHFNAIWDLTDTDDNLEILEIMRKDPKTGSDKKWRPTGRNVEEQIRPLEVNKLKWHNKFYEKQLQFQKQQIEAATRQVERSREKLASAQKRSEQATLEVEAELQDFKRIDAQITDIADRIVHDMNR